MIAAIAAANRLTTRWAETADGTATVFSGAGAWPLLALLAAAADGQARAELAAATGVPAATAHEAVGPLLAALEGSPSTTVALGSWTRAALPLTDWWRATVPAHLRGELTGEPLADRLTLAAWIRERTAGRVSEAPVAISRATELLLLSVLAVRTEWEQPFEEIAARFGADRGRWIAGLLRHSPDLDEVSVADTAAGPLTLFTARGRDDVDVVLALGEPDRSAGTVLAAACANVAAPARAGSRLPVGTAAPGLTVDDVPATEPAPLLTVGTIAFAVTGSHDLLGRPDLFGLGAATSPNGDHFPLLCRTPLRITDAAQDVAADFTARGFDAVAVTALAVAAGARPPAVTRRREVRVIFDRPFGFLAVHRPTGLIMVAGWVTDGLPLPMVPPSWS